MLFGCEVELGNGVAEVVCYIFLLFGFSFVCLCFVCFGF